MATAPANFERIVDLRQLPYEQLEGLLIGEADRWREELLWDFSASADLVKRFVRMNALQGFALLVDEELVGFSYYVCEEHKGLIGDLYLAPGFSSSHYERRLLEAVVDALIKTPSIRRIEAQLLMMQHSHRIDLPWPSVGTRFDRQFLSMDLALAKTLPPVQFGNGLRFEPWSENRFGEVASFIAHSYRQHVDGQLNDQYRSQPGARRFLVNITQYPGCGNFQRSQSFLAVDVERDRVVGLILASSVASSTGHITQVCVAPEARGQGIGYELMRRSLVEMISAGKQDVTLTVTSENRAALNLYKRMGFVALKRFPAMVWEGFR